MVSMSGGGRPPMVLSTLILASALMCLPTMSRGFLYGKPPFASEAPAPVAAASHFRWGSRAAAHLGEGATATRSVAEACILGRSRSACSGKTGRALTACRASAEPNSINKDLNGVDACAEEVGSAARNPAVYTFFAAAAILVTGMARAWHSIVDRVIVFWELFFIYLGNIARPLVEQYHLVSLLLLDASRRLAQRSEARLGGAAAPARLPHVDNIFSIGRKKKNKSSGGMGMGMGDKGPTIKDVVLVGGGHAHAYVLKNFGMDKMDGVRVTLITRDIETPYSGMLPGHIAGIYTREECHIDLGRLAGWAGVRLIHAEAVAIDSSAKRVVLSGGRPPVPYDVLSINIGSAPALNEAGRTPGGGGGAGPSITPVKPIDGFARRWDLMLERAYSLAASHRGSEPAMRLVVVGGGAGGVELALSMHARLIKEFKARGRSPELVKVSLVARGKMLMPAHNRQVAGIFERICGERGIDLVLGDAAKSVSGGFVHTEAGRKIQADEVVWCTSAGAAKWLRGGKTTLALNGDGFIRVKTTLESENTPGVFAAGDCCDVRGHPRPKAGVFAVRAGPPLARNIRARLLGREPEEWLPQTSFLGIIGTGDPCECVASKGNMGLEGAWLWSLKDWIDRTWMAGYSTSLPSMEAPPLPISAVALAAGGDAVEAESSQQMRCSGCAAKVPADVLSRVMKRLREDAPSDGGALGGGGRNGVIVGVDGGDDCAIVSSEGKGFASVHTVDFLKSMVDDPYVLGVIAANHALSDCHAMGAEPRTALAMAIVPYGVEDKVEDTLYQMMSGAVKSLAESGCILVGGHTCEGADLSLGFAVNGALPPSSPALLKAGEGVSKTGLKPGLSLIVTKPVGTGVILAAHMRGDAKGTWVAAATESMVKSNGPAVPVLRKHQVVACTDVTGFGLAGHLAEMIKGGKVNVDLRADEIPAIMGAIECLDKGVRSSLDKANARHSRLIRNAAGHDGSRLALLFDPQTSGGLLALVPSQNASQCVQGLKAAGYTEAAVIGETTAAAPVPEGACGMPPIRLI